MATIICYQHTNGHAYLQFGTLQSFREADYHERDYWAGYVVWGSQTNARGKSDEARAFKRKLVHTKW